MPGSIGRIWLVRHQAGVGLTARLFLHGCGMKHTLGLQIHKGQETLNPHYTLYLCDSLASTINPIQSVRRSVSHLLLRIQGCLHAYSDTVCSTA